MDRGLFFCMAFSELGPLRGQPAPTLVGDTILWERLAREASQTPRLLAD